MNDKEIDAEIKKLEEKEEELKRSNQRLKEQSNDLRDLLKKVNKGNEQNAQQMLERKHQLESEIDSLQKALLIQEKHGSHMEKVGELFKDNEED